jgi:hypothetical protein
MHSAKWTNARQKDTPITKAQQHNNSTNTPIRRRATKTNNKQQQTNIRDSKDCGE